jgi:archaemetzincin
MWRLAFAFLFVSSCISCNATTNQPASNIADARKATKEIQELRAAVKKIEPFFKPMGKPEEYDWLDSHKEPGQTFEEYLIGNPTKPTKERQKIYVLPLGTFTPEQTKIIDIAAGYLAEFYDLPVEKMLQRALSVPAEHIRQNQYSKTRQVRTGHILNDILLPIVPKDAAALIAFTNDDLYPDETMNFVFGQASLENRVGVWSLQRLNYKADFDLFLRRTLKIAAHETGHMFSMRHCTKYECVMSGTNHLGETDRRPIDACPECMAKICWLSDIAAAERYKKLEIFSRRNGLTAEADDFARKATAVSQRTANLR